MSATTRRFNTLTRHLLTLASRALPDSLFGRLALLLFVTAMLSHVLALSLLFEWLGPPGGPPHTAGGMPPPPPPHDRPHEWHLGMVLDVGIRLSAVLLAAWVGARWLSRPVNQLAHAATQWAHRLQGPALPVHGPAELRKATQAFNDMQAQIRQQLHQRDRFVAAVSHDLRTPLTRLRLRAECMADDPDVQRLRQDIAEMDDMIRATLDHLSGGNPAEPLVCLDVCALVQSLVDNEADAGHPVVLALHHSAVRGRPLVMGQAVALKRCVGNLVANAIRYGACARVSVALHGGRVVVTVADNGPGLPPDELEKVKLPFYRAEPSRNRQTGGVGLGLAIANDVATAHHGSLTLANQPQGGLVVTLALPAA